MQDATEYLKLAEAIEKAPIIPPCMTTDPEIWFPEFSSNVPNYRMAKKLCSNCPVARECLAYALATNEQYGVWGGLTTDERRRLRGRGRGRQTQRRPNQKPRLD